MKCIILVLSLLLGSLFFFSCTKDPVCTEEMKFVFVHVKDQAGKPVVLDDHYTIELSSGEEIRYGVETWGPYILLSGYHMDKTTKDGSKFEFVGVLDEKEVIRREFTIGNDGCDFKLKAGDPVIILEINKSNK
jgi:hypothetical protein